MDAGWSLSTVTELTGDPGWLLSTMAQSTAALVAILGGFVLNRVIAEHTRREQAKHDAADAARRAAAAKSERAVLDAERETYAEQLTIGSSENKEERKAEARTLWDRMHPRWVYLLDDIDSINIDYGRAKAALEDVTAYKLATRTLRALATVALVGLVLPIGMLAVRQREISDELAAVVAVLFLVSLAVLAVTIVRVLGEIRAPIAIEDLE